jgi:L-fuconolactonase
VLIDYPPGSAIAYAKRASYGRRRIPLKGLYAVYGPERLMWGTDWPVCEKWTTYGKTLAVVRDEMKFLNEEDKGWILSKTVEHVWLFP